MKQTFGRYEAEGLLGRGGSGVVLRGHDPLLDRPVAIKVLNPDTRQREGRFEKYRELFLTEARASARLVHPNIVTVYDVGFDESSSPYIVMEIVDGTSLAVELRAGGPLAPERVARIGEQLAQALGCAHAVGLVHRDVKPANALLTNDGSAKLMDFGLANFSYNTATREHGRFIGSLHYASPEQLRGKVLDARSDLYSLGVTLYILLTGRNPFRRYDRRETVQAILELEPPPASAERGAVDPRWDSVLSRAMAKRRGDRFVDAGAMAEALSRLGRSEPAVRPGVGGQTYELVIVKGPEHGRSIELAGKLVIGRSKEADFRLGDASISSRHCEVVRRGARVVIRDLGSRNGTWVGSDTVEQTSIEPGSMFRIGHSTTVRLNVREEEPEPEIPTLIDQRCGTARVKAERIDESGPRYALQVVAGPALGRTLALDGALVLHRGDGRGGLSDPQVSRKHASVELESDGRVVVRDFASTNGTWRGSERVRELELVLSDRFRVGSTVLELALASSSPDAPARPPENLSDAALSPETEDGTAPATAPPGDGDWMLPEPGQ